MPRKRGRKGRVKKQEIPYENEAKKCIRNNNYIKMEQPIHKENEPLPEPAKVRNYLDEKLRICSDRSFRVILVEDYDNYKIFIHIPGIKTECDFIVWYAKYSNDHPYDINIPTHDFLGKWYNNIKRCSNITDEFLINAVIRLIRDRYSISEIINRYFKSLDDNLKLEIKKFLSTLKWVCFQEDVNYPPPKFLGSKYVLAVYALLEVGFNIEDTRRIIKF